jgi:hypothetical protein
MLRANLNVEALRGRLRAGGVVEIRDFLTPDWARALHHFLDQEMSTSRWTVAVRAGGEPEYFPDVPENKGRIGEAYRRALSTLRGGEFSYCFRRTWDDHGVSCSCMECRLREGLKSAEVLQFMHDLGFSDAKPREVFASCYMPGSFLSPHHDQGNGQLGFVLNLSRGWNPQYGGLLMFLNDDWKTVRRVCSPRFNTMCLFELPNGRSVPHLVSHVVAGKRLAVTGWYGAAH